MCYIYKYSTYQYNECVEELKRLKAFERAGVPVRKLKLRKLVLDSQMRDILRTL